MIVTTEQQRAIQQELNYAVKYKETYDELYDHVMLIIEKMPGNVTVYGTTLTKNIIDNEFGGYEGLKQMEKDRAKLLFKVLRKKHGQNLIRFFNWPTIAFTLMLCLTGYYLAINLNHRYIKLLIAAIALAPILFVLYRRVSKWIIAWKFDEYSKQSIKDNYIFTAAILSNSLLNVFNFFNSDYILYGSTLAFVFVCYNIYVLSFFKLYRDEYKINLAV
jgi:hypothetical protein